MSQYSFPILQNKEILLCLQELQMAATEEDLLKPTPVKVQTIYAQFIELLLGEKRDEMVQPAFKGIQELEFPELHEESVPTVSFLNAWYARRAASRPPPPRAPRRLAGA